MQVEIGARCCCHHFEEIQCSCGAIDQVKVKKVKCAACEGRDRSQARRLLPVLLLLLLRALVQVVLLLQQ